jgi:hypothetical protein
MYGTLFFRACYVPKLAWNRVMACNFARRQRKPALGNPDLRRLLVSECLCLAVPLGI